MTLSNDQKTPGGTTGFSLNPGVVKRWEVNGSYRAVLGLVFYQHLQYTLKSHAQKDQGLLEMKKMLQPSSLY